MKIGLQMGLGQHLTMTPQLQQAIKLLQLSTLELQQEVQSALDSNPLLASSGSDEGGDAGEDDKESPDDFHFKRYCDW